MRYNKEINIKKDRLLQMMNVSMRICRLYAEKYNTDIEIIECIRVLNIKENKSQKDIAFWCAYKLAEGKLYHPQQYYQDVLNFISTLTAAEFIDLTKPTESFNIRDLASQKDLYNHRVKINIKVKKSNATLSQY